MLLSRLILVTVKGEHDGLEEDVDLGHRDKSTKRGDVPRFRLEEEEEVAVRLGTR